MKSYYSYRAAKYDPHNCEICNISCNSEKIYNLHIMGKKHQKAQKKLEENQFRCNLCNVTCNDLDKWKLHQNKREHLLKIQQDCLNQIKERREKNEISDPLKCLVCDRKFDSNVILQSHLTGWKHKQNIKEKEIQVLKELKDPSVFCEICNVTMHPANMTLHLNSYNHNKNIRIPHRQRKNIINKSLEYCPICDEHFESGTIAKIHYKTDHHQDNVSKKDDFFYWCDVCHIQVQSLEVLNDHFAGLKHYLVLNRDNLNPEGPFKDKLLKKRQKLIKFREKDNGKVQVKMKLDVNDTIECLTDELGCI